MAKKSTTSVTKLGSAPIIKALKEGLGKIWPGCGVKTEKGLTGKWGENLAASYLKKEGYKIVERNYRSNHGEIDVVALDGDTLIFVEVKTRSSNPLIQPEFAVTKSKQKKIKKCASHYLTRHRIENKDCRFDIVAIVIEKDKNSITLFKDAF